MDDAEIDRLLDEASRDREAIGPALEAYRSRIERMLRLRMDPRVAARVGVSDVVQDAYLEVAKRLPKYLEERRRESTVDPSDAARPAVMPFFPWVRFIAAQALALTHRTHLGTQARDAGRDLPIAGGRWASAGNSSMVLASALLERGASPSTAAGLEEQREILASALAELSETDREILLLKHFEQLSTKEIATILGLTYNGASVRHVKALRRLQAVLARSGLGFGATDGVAPLAPPENRGHA